MGNNCCVLCCVCCAKSDSIKIINISYFTFTTVIGLILSHIVLFLMRVCSAWFMHKGGFEIHSIHTHTCMRSIFIDITVAMYE